MPKQPALSPDILRQRYLDCLGGPFPEPPPLLTRHRETIRKTGYRIESLAYQTEPNEWVPALLLIPDTATPEQPTPGIALWHQHNDEYTIGKSEPAGLAGDPQHHTAVALVQEGYVVLCPDTLGFEERQDPTGKLTGEDYERFEFLRQVIRGRSLAWKNILDMRRAIDFLCTRPEVLADRIGCYGHSMGSTQAWQLAPLEPRLACVAGNCCLPTYEAIETEHLRHCFTNFIPGWSKFGDTPDIAALTAPCPLHLNFGELDAGSPIEFVRQGLEQIVTAYQAANAAEHFSWFIETGQGHVLTDAMWTHVKSVFARHLKRDK